ARRDLQAMAAAGVNTVRTYTLPPRWFLDLAAEQGLMVIAGVFWEGRHCLFEDPAARRAVEETVRIEVTSIAGHPALLMVCLGNEIPPLIARWHGKRKVERLLRQLHAAWEKGCAGATVYAWTDDWAVAGRAIEDWDFGLVDRQRQPKPALEAVSAVYFRSHAQLREERVWPLASVVCCAYNAAATL